MSSPVRRPAVPPSPAASPVASLTAPGLPTPRAYAHVCTLLTSVCQWANAPDGSLPIELVRPLRIPGVAGSCPAPRTRPLPPEAGFGDPVYDLGVPVSVGAAAVVQRPATAAHADPRDGGWASVKALWFAYPSYRGPFLVRGHRVDAPGVVAFGEGPVAGWLVVPPGNTLNEDNGYRQAPGGLWVRAPGCYGFQVDGLDFSVTLTLRIDYQGRTP